MCCKPQKYNHLTFAFFALIWLFFGVKVHAQTIDVTGTSENPICAGSAVTVDYTLTDGKGGGVGGNKQFQAGTIITISLNETITGSVKLTEFTLTESDIPASNTTGIYNLSTEVIIPANSLHSINYEIVVDSQNPSPQGNKAGAYPGLVIDAQIGNNTITEFQSGCNPFTSQPLTGTLPTGGNNTYTYLWESSTADSTSGFSPASGTNDAQNYDPGTLTQTTWYRRVVTSGACTNESNVIEINVTNDNTWTGALDSNWNTAGNWSCNAVPIPVTNVIIPLVTNQPILNTGAAGTANDISIETGAQLTITTNTLELGGNISNNGIFDSQNGSLKFVGTAAQTLPAGSLFNNRIANFTVNNPAGLTLSGPVEVTGTVLAATGDITSNGNLKLISDSTQTALVDGSGTGEVLGNVIMQRHLDVAYGYKYFSTPFKNTTVGDFSLFLDIADPVTDFPHFYSYDESRQSNGEDASGWVIDTVKTKVLKPGSGYAVNFGSSSAFRLVELSGEVNNEQIDINLKNNNGSYTKGFHLLGNPYSSPIDWTQVSRTNIEDAVYFFTAGNTDQYTGVYSSVVAGVSSDGNSSTIIPSMQGFFVKVVDGASGSISFQNSARVTDFSQKFLKIQKRGKNTSFPLVRLKAGFEKELTDALAVYFPETGQPEFEKDKDAQKLLNTDPNVPNFYSILENGQKLSINALPFSQRTIPLGIKSKRKGKMIISLQTANLKDQVYLKDFETGIITNLSEKGSYHFQISKGEHNDRFQLFFSNKNLVEEEDKAFSPLSVFTRKNDVVVDIKIANTQNGILQVINLNGEVVRSSIVKGAQRVEFNNFSNPGLYIISLLSKEKRFSKKIILHY